MDRFTFATHVTSLREASSGDREATLVECDDGRGGTVSWACSPEAAPELGSLVSVSVEVVA